MATELVGLKIKITRGLQGNKMCNQYPPFNDMPGDKRGNMDWSYYIDDAGTGWKYDKVSGFGESDPENPDPSCQYAILAVPQAFADEAVAKWPALCAVIDETEFERFHDERATAHMSVESLDTDVLSGLRAKYGVVGGFDAEDIAKMEPDEKDALDPEKDNPGRRKNKTKKWTDVKAAKGISIKAVK